MVGGGAEGRGRKDEGVAAGGVHESGLVAVPAEKWRAEREEQHYARDVL